MKYDLRSTLASNYPADSDDVWLTKKVLAGTGYYKEPKHGMTVYPDSQLFEAIKKFQSDGIGSRWLNGARRRNRSGFIRYAGSKELSL